jgi:hypothetical protein
MKPKKKSLLVSVFDTVLFAPAKFIDKYGNNPKASNFTNAINQPSGRALAITTIFAAAVNLGQDDLGNVALAVGTALFVPLYIGAYKKLHGGLDEFDDLSSFTTKDYLLDTVPDNIPPIPPEILSGLKNIQEEAKEISIHSAKALATAVAIMLVLVDDYRQEFLTFIAQYAAYVGMQRALPHYWRSTRALNGEWGVLTSLPEKEPEKELLSAPAPTQA